MTFKERARSVLDRILPSDGTIPPDVACMAIVERAIREAVAEEREAIARAALERLKDG